jgi:hypothetical protein
MSRRHSSSRRRNYGRRQHEIHERRPGPVTRGEWTEANEATMGADWQIAELDDARPTGAAERYDEAPL